MQNSFIFNLMTNQYFVMFLVLWELCWKGLAMWKASKAGQKAFFVAILVFNTIGILPIAYLIYRKVLEKRQAIVPVK